jgi:replicative DNA helicase
MESFELLEIEKRIIKALIDGNNDTKKYILRKFKQEHFYNLGGVFSYIQSMLASGDPLLITLDSLTTNPTFDQPTRGILASLVYVPLISEPAQLEVLTQPIIEQYGTTNVLEAIRPTIEKLQLGEVPYEEALSNMLQTLEAKHAELIQDNNLPLAIGVGGDLADVIARITTPIVGRFLRTGFRSIDEFVGGFCRGDVVVMAAPSSHGKTLMLLQLLNNMQFYQANQKISVLYITMEVQDITTMHRLMSVRTQIPNRLVREITMDPALLTEFCTTEKQKADRLAQVEEVRVQVAEETARMYGRLEELGQKMEIKHYGAFTPEDMLREMSLHPYDVVIVDYLNLMTTTNQNDSDWMRLGQIVRQFKNIATTKNMVVITAQQLDEVSKDIRYGKIVKEHADILIKWELSEELREAHEGIADVKVAKGRNIGTFKFPVFFNLNLQTAKEQSGMDTDSMAQQTLGNSAGETMTFGGASFENPFLVK